MGKKASLSSEEKEILIRQLGNGIDTLKIAKTLGRDHKSVKNLFKTLEEHERMVDKASHSFQGEIYQK